MDIIHNNNYNPPFMDPGFYFLHLAARMGATEICLALIEEGVEINPRTDGEGLDANTAPPSEAVEGLANGLWERIGYLGDRWHANTALHTAAMGGGMLKHAGY
ncbi:MAG: hypothetical protein VXY77_02975 [Pseudomonadota bacterium]|nr:hypothetical protein [Pseudomonadota bacterium]